jgi:GAF domain-containing protein
MNHNTANYFGRNIIPENEAARLHELEYYKLLEGLPEGYFTNLAHIVAQTFDTPIALVSLVDSDSVLFPGNVGMEGAKEVPRGMSLCSLAVLDDNPTIFNDALEEPCLLANPLVSGDFGLRFYAGAPIITKLGFAIGTVCVVDKEPRAFSGSEKQMLRDFAAAAMEEIERRLQLMQSVSVL